MIIAIVCSASGCEIQTDHMNRFSLSSTTVHRIIIGTCAMVVQKIIVDATPGPIPEFSDIRYVITPDGSAVRTIH